MDGKFVEKDTYNKMLSYAEYIKRISNLPLDVHLMVNNVEHAINDFEVVEPNKKPYIITVEDLYNLDDDEKVDVANKATDTYSFKCDIPISQDAIFRRQRTE